MCSPKFHILHPIIANIILQQVSYQELIVLVVAILLLFIAAIISASEIAFFSIDTKTRHELEQSKKNSDKSIARLLESPQKLLATILITNSFFNVAVILLLTYLSNTIVQFDSSPMWAFISQAIIITFIILIFSEITPKLFASEKPIETATLAYPIIQVLQSLFAPLVTIMVKSTTIVNKKLARLNKTNISMDELSHALELTSDNSNEDTEILEGIIKFGNIQVVDIMTSRVDMVDLDIKTTYRKLLDMIISSGYSRIPVYSGNRDNVKGILYSKDLLPHLDKPDTFRWQSLIRPAYYVPETKKIDDLLNEFQKNRIHLAIVVDEYGGTSGLVTLEDILEEIVGDITDEYDEEEKLYTKIDNHTFLFEAKIQLNDLFKIDEIDEDDFRKISEDVETLAGLILELKGEIPGKNERIDFKKYVFEIQSVDNRRIKKVKLFIKGDHQEDENF